MCFIYWKNVLDFFNVFDSLEKCIGFFLMCSIHWKNVLEFFLMCFRYSLGKCIGIFFNVFDSLEKCIGLF